MVAGLLGAAVMAAVSLAVSALRGQGVSTPIDLISAALGDSHPDFLRAVFALLLHLGLGAAWGLLFGALLPWHAPRSASVVSGLLYAVAVWTVMTFGGMPWAQVSFRNVRPDWLLLFHSPYGLALGYLTPYLRGSEARSPPFARRIERRAEG
jgi:hypothetical protein